MVKNKLITILKEKFGDQRVKINEPLALYTSFKVGGPAEIYFQALTIEELILAIFYAKKLTIPYFVMGGGTNLLISDQGYEGLVVRNSANKITLKNYNGSIQGRKATTKKASLEVLSGVGVNQLVRFTLAENLTGLEAFLGQPGTVGGAVYINAHNLKMGEFFGEKIQTAKVLTENGDIKEVSRAYFKFGYDQSILQHKKEIVLSVKIDLAKGKKAEIWQKANQALEHRRLTQPAGKGSAGCIFRNISFAEALRIGTPKHTTSAGYLIEAVGLKGYTFGGAKISDKHANFIINTGEAKASDILFLIKLIKQKVKARFGVTLQEEIISL